MDWLDLLAVQWTLKSLLQHHSSKASILWPSAFFIVQLSHPYMTTGKTIVLTRRTFVGKVMAVPWPACGISVVCCYQWLWYSVPCGYRESAIYKPGMSEAAGNWEGSWKRASLATLRGTHLLTPWSWTPKLLQMVTAAMKLKDICSLEEKLWQPRQHTEKQRHYLANKGLSSQNYGFSSSNVWMWELDHKESWKWKSLGSVWLFAIQWTIQSMEFSRPEYWSG